MNLPFNYIHDVICGYGRLLFPIPCSRGRWLMVTKNWRLRQTYCGGFHNCTRTGVY